MIDVTQAVKSAESFARAVYPESDLRYLRLEEVECGESRWNVTLGWVEPAETSSGIMFIADMRKLPRLYKRFEVDGETGEVKSMKIRDVE